MSLRTGRALFSAAHKRTLFNLAFRSPLRSLTDNLLAAKNAQAIHATYPAFVTSYVDSKSSLSPLSKKQFSDLLRLLAKSARPGDIDRMKDIIGHMHTLFRLNMDPTLHSDILRAFAQAGQVEGLFSWIRIMPTLPGSLPPSLTDYHTVFVELQNFGVPFTILRQLVQSMRISGTPPVAETFLLLIQARWSVAKESGDALPDPYVFLSIIKDMKGLPIPYHAEILHALCDPYQDSGMGSSASLLHDAYLDLCSIPPNRDFHQHVQWEHEIADVARRGGVDAAIVAFQKLEKQGCTLTSRIAHAILRRSKTIDDLVKIEQVLGFKPTPPHWFLVINNNLLANDIDNASFIYQRSKEAGVAPDLPLLTRFVTKLCRPDAGLPSNAAVASALALYRDVLLASRHSKSSHRSIQFYRALVRGLASCPKPHQFVDVVASLREELSSSSMRSDPSLATSFTIFLMRTASDLEEAFERYLEQRADLDAHGYQAVLAAFCSLPVGSHIPSAELYFSIATHMKAAGYPWTVEVYTIFLKQIANLASLVASNPEIQSKMVNEIRRTHNLLKLDASVTPDAPLYNQLMDAYQRLGDFASCLKLWDAMFSSGRFNEASVSIIFDACGFAGNVEMLMSIRDRLLRDNFPFNSRNWRTFVEALARMGFLNEAARFVCLEMGENGLSKPDPGVARQLLRACRRSDQRTELTRLLKEYHPHLFEDGQLKSSGSKSNVDIVDTEPMINANTS